MELENISTEATRRNAAKEAELMKGLLKELGVVQPPVKIKQKCQKCGIVFEPNGKKNKFCPDCLKQEQAEKNGVQTKKVNENISLEQKRSEKEEGYSCSGGSCRCTKLLQEKSELERKLNTLLGVVDHLMQEINELKRGA